MEEQKRTKEYIINELVAFGEQAHKIQAMENESKRLREYLVKLGECLLNLGNVPDENINRLVSVCGEFMGAACALYNRLDGGMLCSIGMWHVPPGYKAMDRPEGHICYDVILHGNNEPVIVHDLQHSRYAATDPNVTEYKLQTYLGMAVKFDSTYVGSLCAVFQKDFTPSAEEIKFMKIVASSIAAEENNRLASLKLKETTERDRLIFETVSDYIFTVRLKDGEPFETIHGPTCSAVTGYTPEDFSKDPDLWIKMVPEEDRPMVDAYISYILSGKKVAPFEHRIIRKDGAECWVRNTTTLHFNKEGKLFSYTGLIQDVTESKYMEDELQRRQKDFQVILDSIPAMVFYKDKDNKMVRINKTFAQYMGLDREKIEGKSCFEIWPPKVAESYWCDDKQVMGLGEPKKGIIEIVPTANGEIWVETDKIPYRDEKGEIAGIIGFAIDITERKKAEEALAASEEQYRTLVNNLNIGVFRNTSVSGGRFIKANPAVAKMFGYGSVEEFLKVETADLYQRAQDRQKFIEKLRASGFVKDEEVRLRKKDGTPIWGAVTAAIHFGGSGEPQWIDGVIEDITERKAAEEKLRLLNKELIKSNKRLKQLALRDPQTGLYNHRYLQDVIEAEFYRAKRYAHPFSVMMLDVDYFKSINDVYGHVFGDLVLKQLSRQLKRMTRQYDIVIRFGGEEFMVICPGIDRNGSLKLARRLLDAVNLYNFGDKEHTVKLKLSAAVASYPEDRIVKGIDLVEIADQILNKVKEYGGNNVYTSLDIKKKAPLSKKPRVDIGSLREKIEKLTRRTNENLIEAVFAFAKTIELKDQYTGEHVEKTVQFATDIARALNLPTEEIERIKQAAILHDLGKIGISEKILDKNSKLNKEEYDEIKKHPQIGVDIIRPIKFLHNIIPLILYHHERWDGKGYPHGLKGEEIPIGARVVAIADVYQALTSNRPYRKAYSQDEALEIIKKGSGSQFDPMVATKFLQLIKQKKD